jgi:predicted dehydrogenase
MNKVGRNFLVIGYGSIGSRHCRILCNQGYNVAVVSQRQDCPFPRYPDIRSALKSFPAEIIIIANRTKDHFSTLQNLLSIKFHGTVLVEKPLFHVATKSLADDTGLDLFVGYNLRFHPIIQRLSHAIKGIDLYSAQFCAGQYLPLWRPGTDYRNCYSAFKSQGGGVLRDLSHELDLLQYLTGTWKRVAAIGGKFSPLEIDSDDIFCLLIETERCPAVLVQINYLDRCPRREIIINAADFSIKADLVSGELTINDSVEIYNIERDDTYANQIRALVNGKYDEMCTYSSAIDVMELIDASEKAAHEKVWKIKK